MIHSKEKVNLNIKKAIGTLLKVQKMIEDDCYCADVAHQINASMWLLQSANRDLLKNHLACCGTKALSEWGKNKDDFIEELVRTWDVATRK